MLTLEGIPIWRVDDKAQLQSYAVPKLRNKDQRVPIGLSFWPQLGHRQASAFETAALRLPKTYKTNQPAVGHGHLASVHSIARNLLLLQGLKGIDAGSAHCRTQTHEDSDKGQQRGRQQNIAQSNGIQSSNGVAQIP